MNQGWANDWYLLGTTTDIADGTIDRCDVGRLSLAVFNASGEYFAARDRCCGCAQSLAGGTVRDNTVECPGCGRRLGFSHNPAGSAVPGKTQLSTFPVMVVNEEIFAWIEGLD